MREFAEQEIILPTGPHKGRRLDISRSPFAALWFAEVSRGWRRNVVTAGQQMGKTLFGFIIPTLYFLFEVCETVLCGLPSLDMVADKWGQDLLPVITASRYRDLLPSEGPGSRGGDTPSITFKHGPTLKFMTGGGGDKARAGFTSRILVITETDGMDEAGTASREADKITQLEGRTSAFGDRARTFMECTVSTETGRTWKEFTEGTRSRIAIRCPHCRAYVTPEREHFTGWQDAADVLQAAELASVLCPGCGVQWSEEDRASANRDCRLVHRGQEIDPDGNVTGAPPRTNTLGFRWTAANNLLVPQGVVGQREWSAHRAADEEAGEREMAQFVWANPAKPRVVDVSALDAAAITTKRMTTETRGVLPAGTEMITTACDAGMWLCHWAAIAWRPGATPHLIDYGRIEVPSDTMATEQALLNAFRQYRDEICAQGWGGMVPAMNLIDAGYLQDVAVKLSQESGETFIPSLGFGNQSGNRKMVRQSGSRVLAIGDGYEVVQLPGGARVIEINANQWKSWFHARLRTPVGKPGAFTLFYSTDHKSYGKHIVAEREMEEFIKGKGLVTRFEAMSRNNHWLDASSMACVAGHAAGQRIITAEIPAAPIQAVERPDRRGFEGMTGFKQKW
jgi:hypothetical protein